MAGNRNRSYGETLTNQACNQPNQEGREEEPSGKNRHDFALFVNLLCILLSSFSLEETR
jgi:hypothetical protein